MKYYVDPHTKGTAQIPEKRHGKSIQFLISGYQELDWAQYLHQVKENNPIERTHYDDESGLYLHRKYWDVDYVDNLLDYLN